MPYNTGETSLANSPLDELKSYYFNLRPTTNLDPETKPPRLTLDNFAGAIGVYVTSVGEVSWAITPDAPDRSVLASEALMEAHGILTAPKEVNTSKDVRDNLDIFDQVALREVSERFLGWGHVLLGGIAIHISGGDPTIHTSGLFTSLSFEQEVGTIGERTAICSQANPSGRGWTEAQRSYFRTIGSEAGFRHKNKKAASLRAVQSIIASALSGTQAIRTALSISSEPEHAQGVLVPFERAA